MRKKAVKISTMKTVTNDGVKTEKTTRKMAQEKRKCCIIYYTYKYILAARI